MSAIAGSMQFPAVANLFTEDLVNRAIRKRYDEEISIRTGLQVGGNAEIRAEKQRLAFRDVEFAQVVGDAIVESRIVDADLLTIAREIKVEQMSAGQKRSRASHE